MHASVRLWQRLGGAAMVALAGVMLWIVGHQLAAWPQWLALIIAYGFAFYAPALVQRLNDAPPFDMLSMQLGGLNVAALMALQLGFLVLGVAHFWEVSLLLALVTALGLVRRTQ